MCTWFGITEEDDFRDTCQYPSCMIGKVTLEDPPGKPYRLTPSFRLRWRWAWWYDDMSVIQNRCISLSSKQGTRVSCACWPVSGFSESTGFVSQNIHYYCYTVGGLKFRFCFETFRRVYTTIVKSFQIFELFGFAKLKPNVRLQICMSVPEEASSAQNIVMTDTGKKPQTLMTLIMS